MNSQIELLLNLLNEGYQKQAWHGPNLRGALRGLSAAEAAWRPAPGRHNIWEIAVHAAYWKYAVRRRLKGDKRGAFQLKGSNWFHRPESPTLEAWQQDLQLLRSEHLLLCEAVGGLAPEKLEDRAPGGTTSNLRLVYGAAMHDVYHAGQIQLVKRLLRG